MPGCAVTLTELGTTKLAMIDAETVAVTAMTPKRIASSFLDIFTAESDHGLAKDNLSAEALSLTADLSDICHSGLS